MKIAIVIPTVNLKTDHYKNCIKSIKAHTVNEYRIITELNDWEGFSVPTNKGIRTALKDEKVEVIVICNDDMILGPGWDEEIIKPFYKDQRIGMVGVQARQSLKNIIYCPFFLVAIPTTAMRKIGLLDERFWAGSEDVDWCHRLQQQGGTIAVNRNVKFVHLTNKTMKQHFKDRKGFDKHLKEQSKLLKNKLKNEKVK